VGSHVEHRPYCSFLNRTGKAFRDAIQATAENKRRIADFLSLILPRLQVHEINFGDYVFSADGTYPVIISIA
jgi:hypothetical protein